MTYGPFTRRHRSLPTGVPADRLPRAAGRFAAVDHLGRVTALVADGPDPAQFGAIAKSAGPTSTSDDDWDGPANEANLDNDDGEKEYRQAFAWVDPDKDADTKAAYAFIHHFVSSGGEVGAASTKACSSGIGVLNGGRGGGSGADWWDDRQGIYNHLVGHLKDSGVKDEDLPELDEAALAGARAFAFWWALDNVVEHHPEYTEDERLAAAELVLAAIKPEELLDQFADPENTAKARLRLATIGYDVPAAATSAAARTTVTTTPIANTEDLKVRVERLRQLQAATPDVERTRVHVLTASGEDTGLELDLAVRWDEEAHDPYWRDEHGHQVGRMGAFVSTVPRRAAGMTAAAGEDMPKIVDNPGAAWHSYLCIEGVRTDEGYFSREIMPGSLQFPDLPVSLRLQIRDEGGHYGAVTCGRIDTMERQPYPEDEALNVVYSTGVFGSDEHGQLGQLLVDEQTQRFVSVDLRDCDYEEVVIRTQVDVISYDYDDDCECDDDGYVEDWWIRVTSGVIGAATVVATPALQQAVIALADVDLPTAPLALERAPATAVTVTAAGAQAAARPSLAAPPAEWFDDPAFHVGDARLVRQGDGHFACPVTRTADGRIFGHVAYWGAEHTGFPGKRRNPPHSPTYAHFMTGARSTAEGAKLAVGNLTMGCGHAPTSLGLEAARAHYHVAHYDGGYGAIQVADVRAGEDDFGIWVAGAVCEGVAEADLRRFDSMGMSGDWRAIAGQLHFIACLAVPVPGFPIAREDALAASAEIVDLVAVRAGMAGEEVVSLVAAGRVQRMSADERLAIVERTLADLLADRAAREGAADRAALADVLAAS